MLLAVDIALDGVAVVERALAVAADLAGRDLLDAGLAARIAHLLLQRATDVIARLVVVDLDQVDSRRDLVEHVIKAALGVLIVLGCVDERHERQKGAEMVAMRGQIVSHIGDERHEERFLGLVPERVATGFLGTGRHRDEHVHERYDLKVRLHVSQRVVDERAVRHERVEDADVVPLLDEPGAHVHDQVAFGVGNHEVAVELHHVGLHVAAGLARTRSAQDEHVHVAVHALVELLAGACQRDVLGKRDGVELRIGVVQVGEDRQLAGLCESSRAVFLSLALVLAAHDEQAHEDDPRYASEDERAQHGGHLRADP